MQNLRKLKRESHKQGERKVIDFLAKILVFYLLILGVLLLSVFLMVNEGWKRNGFYQSVAEANATTKELWREKHWTARFVSIMVVVSFFYCNIPITLYERFVKKNQYAHLLDPRGKHPELYNVK